MKITHRYLNWDSHPKITKAVRSVLDKYKVSYEYKEEPNRITAGLRYSIEFYLDEDLPDFAVLKSKIDKFGFLPQTGTVYDEADSKKAEWRLSF